MVRFQSGRPQSLELQQSMNLCCFNVLTLVQIGQQACLALKMSSPAIDVRYISETQIQNLSSIG